MKLLALELVSGKKLNIFNAASTLVSISMESAINALQKWTYDLMLSVNINQVRYHPQYFYELFYALAVMQSLMELLP